MPFNIDNYEQAPYTSGVMELTHEEVVEIKDKLATVQVESTDPLFIIAAYNKLDYNKAINGETYAYVIAYDVEVNKLGIDQNGIIQPEPIVEQPVEGEETEVVYI